MNMYHGRLTVLLLAVLCACGNCQSVSTDDLDASLAKVGGVLEKSLGGQWETKNGQLTGVKTGEKGVPEFVCVILPQPRRGSAAVRAWEYRMLYCSAPCFVFAQTEDLVLATIGKRIDDPVKQIAAALNGQLLDQPEILAAFAKSRYGLVRSEEGLHLIFTSNDRPPQPAGVDSAKPGSGQP